MKKLTIEQKAKAYDGLIERLKDLKFAYRFSPLSDTIEEIFPELAESEDERIRKYIIKYFETSKEELSEGFKWNGITVEECIAWLEKQGEQRPFDYEIANIQQKDFAPKSALKAVNEERVDNVNKVEPKFHKGEWLCENEPNNYARFIQILEIVNVQGKDRYSMNNSGWPDEVGFDSKKNCWFVPEEWEPDNLGLGGEI